MSPPDPPSPPPPLAPIEATFNWTDPDAWRGPFPVAGWRGIIPSDRHVLLDISPPALDILVIDGTLTCHPEVTGSLVLRVKFLLVTATGSLNCGSSHNGTVVPFGGSLSIELVQDQTSLVMQRLSNRAIVYGKLKLFGQKYTSWVRLNSSAVPWTREIVVQGAIDWQAGASVVMTPAIDAAQSEVRRVDAVHVVQNPDGSAATVLELDSSLYYHHVGVTEQYGERTIEMRSEVGLLTRAISIHAAPGTTGVLQTPANMMGGEELGSNMGWAPFYDDPRFPWDGMQCDDGEPATWLGQNASEDHPERTSREKMLFDGDCLQLSEGAWQPFPHTLQRKKNRRVMRLRC